MLARTIPAESNLPRRGDGVVSSLRYSPLLKALFRNGDGLIELRALPSRKTAFVPPADFRSIDGFIQKYVVNQDIYFGVAARRDSSSGSLGNCSVIRAVFADLDFKDFHSTEAAERRMGSFPLRPSFIIDSGGGRHLYWLLRDPVDLAVKASNFKDILRGTARQIGADLASAEPARILRLPGTLNHKYSPSREVQIVL